MPSVTSKDGTHIAYEKVGRGAPVILVDGAFGYRAFGPNHGLAKLLAEDFTVYTYDRRGRGESGDGRAYEPQREIEDLKAVINVAGGTAGVYGISSGAVLALEAAKQLPCIEKLVVFEATMIVDDTRPVISDTYAARLSTLIKNDDRSGAIKLFMREGVGVPAIGVFFMQLMPAWKQMKTIAHTLPYDTAIVEKNQKGKPLVPEEWQSLKIPAMVIVGGKSPEWMQNGMKMLAEVLPNSCYVTLPGQTHIVDAKALAPSIINFLNN